MNVFTRFSAPSNRVAVQQSIKIVRKIIADNPSGLTTSELFKLVFNKTYPLAFKSTVSPLQLTRYGKEHFPEHPIRSKSFLKHNVIPILRTNRELQLVHTQRLSSALAQPQSKGASIAVAIPDTVHSIDAWVWRPLRPPLVTSHAKKPMTPIGSEVGVGLDWSHLSKRRREARIAKVAREFTVARPRLKLVENMLSEQDVKNNMH